MNKLITHYHDYLTIKAMKSYCPGLHNFKLKKDEIQYFLNRPLYIIITLVKCYHTKNKNSKLLQYLRHVR